MFFYATFNELTRENKRAVKEATLAEIKLMCANEIISRQKRQLHKAGIPQLTISENLFTLRPRPKPLKNLFPHLKKSVGAALMITPTLFGTYYFATSGILAAFGLSTIAAFMTGPIGIGIAMTIALAVGIYFGYTLYQACKKEELFNRRFKRVEHESDYKRKLCYEQRNKLQCGKRPTLEIDPIKPLPTPNLSCATHYGKMPVLLLNRSTKNTETTHGYYSRFMK